MEGAFCESEWVKRQDGSRKIIEAPSVVLRDAGDWVEYGSDAGPGDGPFCGTLWDGFVQREEPSAHMRGLLAWADRRQVAAPRSSDLVRTESWPGLGRNR
jgi:hypothetical protein